jgi:hypothetical protein
MGYANVFNNYGRWMFYSGSAAAFDYAERTTQFEALTKKTLERLNLSETPSIYFHYSSKFSKEDKEAILKAARSVRPAGTYYFVWINTHHNIRLYDSRPETDGSLGRGSYVRTSNWQFFLSTTGYNPFRKTLGTPHMLEINASVNRPKGSPEALPDTKGLAMQILSLRTHNHQVCRRHRIPDRCFFAAGKNIQPPPRFGADTLVYLKTINKVRCKADMAI